MNQQKQIEIIFKVENAGNVWADLKKWSESESVIRPWTKGMFRLNSMKTYTPKWFNDYGLRMNELCVQNYLYGEYN